MESKIKLHGIFLGPISMLSHKTNSWVNTTQIKSMVAYSEDDSKALITMVDETEYITDINIFDLLAILEGTSYTLKESNKETENSNFY